MNNNFLKQFGNIDAINQAISVLMMIITIVATVVGIAMANNGAGGKGDTILGSLTPHPEYDNGSHSDGKAYQGDRIIVNGVTNCTLGFIDKKNAIAYTAAHCGALAGGKNKDYDGKAEVTTSSGKKIGTMFYPDKIMPNVPFPPYEEYLRDISGDNSVDLAAIKIEDLSAVGDNTFSGDTMVSYSDVNVGDKACVRGYRSNKTMCGEVYSKDMAHEKDGIYHSRHWITIELDNSKDDTIGGDSGGVAWIPGKGAIGVIYGGDKAIVAVTGFNNNVGKHEG